MAKCAVCRVLLPPDFLTATADGLAKKCIFCERGSNTIEDFSSSERKQVTITKENTAKEYQIFLKEVSSMPSVSDIIDALKEKESGLILS